MGDFPTVNGIYESYFEKGKYPARICYAVAALPKESKIEIDAIAVRGSIGESVSKKQKKEWWHMVLLMA